MTASPELLAAVRDAKVQLGYDPDTAVQAHLIAGQLPEHFRGPFWREAVDRYITHQDAVLRASGRCQVCGNPTDTPPECGDCFTAADALAVRRADT